MSNFKSTSVEIYVGGAIEHASERRVLQLLVEELSQLDQWAFVIANVHIASHQVDFIVGSDAHCLLIEAKTYLRPVRGEPNGDWQVEVGPDTWRPTRNAYQQALGAKNALRDLIGRLDGQVQGYPDASVVCVPSLPRGSNITASDFKVRVESLEELRVSVRANSGARWPRERWRKLVTALRVTAVHSVTDACSAELLEDQARLDTYRGEFLRTYQSELRTFQPDTYTAGEAEFDAVKVAAIVADADEDLIIRGPSGCGKSLLSMHIAIVAAQGGFVPIAVQAKHFTGRLRPLLEQEVALLGTSFAMISRAARRTGRQLLLVVDGYNECAESLRTALTRSLAALSRRGARLIVSSQVGLERSDLLTLGCVTVREPPSALKMAIVQAISPQSNVESVGVLLSFVTSGFEADVVGQLEGALEPGLSRSALMDAYARKRLGALASDGTLLLAEVAGWLSDRFTFSMSVRDMDRLIYEVGSSPDVLRAAHDARLVTSRAGRISFHHELLFNAFSAEAVVRRSRGSARKVLAALSSPRFDNCRIYILGAIDDEALAAEVLAGTADRELLAEAADGQCGQFAQRWVQKRCQDVLSRAIGGRPQIRSATPPT